MEIAPGIHRLQAPLGDRFVCLFLLVGEEAALLVDSGLDAMPREVLAPYLDEIALPFARLRYLVTSHADFDHSGGNASVRELAPDAHFLCHELDRAMIEDVDLLIVGRYGEFAAGHGIDDTAETKAFIRSASRHVGTDIALTGGESIRLGKDWEVRVLSTPGHTRGHLSIHDPRSNTLIIADAALGNVVRNADGTPAFPPTYRYVESYVSTLERLRMLSAEVLLTGHYPVMRGADAADFLYLSRSYVDRVEDALRGALDEPRSLRELTVLLGPKLGGWPESAHCYLSFPLYGHLERLMLRGCVTSERRGGLLHFQNKQL